MATVEAISTNSIQPSFETRSELENLGRIKNDVKKLKKSIDKAAAGKAREMRKLPWRHVEL